MRAFQIRETGSFMSGLLSGDLFDAFLLEEASLHTAVHWQTDGRVNRDFYDSETWNDPAQRPYELAQWKQVRPYFRELIKGTRAPSSFRFVLHLKPETMTALLSRAGLSGLSDSIAALVLTIRYDGKQVSLVTGVGMKTFMMDRSADKMWDDAMQRFLVRADIAFDPLT